MKLAVIDLDGVVVDCTARFARAEEIKQSYLHPDGKDAIDVYWRAVFDPEYVPLDTLIDGVKEALDSIRFKHHLPLLFLTSRPEAMREATAKWLYAHDILFYLDGREALVMKAGAFQYVKTLTWKAGIIQTLSTLYGADDALVVDDEPVNIQEIEKYRASFGTLTTARSLAEAVAKLNGTWKEPDPFAPEAS